MDTLPALPAPLGRLDEQFLNPQRATTLILKEKIFSLTGDAFEIKLDPGNGREPYPVLKVDPSILTSKRAFSDMSGRHLFDLKKEHFHPVHEYMKLVDAEDNKFCEMKKHITGTYVFALPQTHTHVQRIRAYR